MSRWSKASAFASLLALGACGWTERAGDFTYACANAFHPLDAPSCEHRLTEHYMLRYGEGSGDEIVLAYRIDDSSSAGLFDFSQRGSNIVRQLALDDDILVAQIQSGEIYVAPAHANRAPRLDGPFTEAEFATRYPSAPPWREVQ
jgi:hypothetical protein